MNNRIAAVYGSVTDADWTDWRWQFRHRLTRLDEWQQILALTPAEEAALGQKQRFAAAVTPYAASLIDPANPHCPIRRQIVPTTAENGISPHDLRDPLAEEAQSRTHNLVHRYPDRVLLLTTETCYTYCRFCTRRRLVGFAEGRLKGAMEEALQYIEQTPSVRDVLISGGDPLTLTDAVLQPILARIQQISHVQVIRLGTRTPLMNPFRITPELVDMLRAYAPLWVQVHFNHPAEMTAEAEAACARLVDAGIPLVNQTVLLRGINDSLSVQKDLAHRLVQWRIRPYYLYQCDLAEGIEHFRTPTAVGVEIMEHLQGHTSGFCLPTYVIDAPGGGGKVPLGPQYWISQERNAVVLRNFEQNVYRYPEPHSKSEQDGDR